MPSLQSMKLANDDFIQINYREWPTLSSFIGPCEEEQVIDEVSHANGLRLHTFTRDSCTRRIALGQSNLGPHPQRGEGAPQFVKRVADKLLSLLRGSTIAAIGSSVLRGVRKRTPIRSVPDRDHFGDAVSTTSVDSGPGRSTELDAKIDGDDDTPQADRSGQSNSNCNPQHPLRVSREPHNPVSAKSSQGRFNISCSAAHWLRCRGLCRWGFRSWECHQRSTARAARRCSDRSIHSLWWSWRDRCSS